MAPLFRLSPLVAVILVVSGCGGGSTPTSPGTPGTPSSNTVTITGAANAEVGTTAQLTAQVRTPSGDPVSGTVSWSSSDNAVVSVDGAGLVTVIKTGPVTITATSGTASGTYTFTGTLAPYTFNFGSETSATDQRTIRDGVQFAHFFYRDTFGRTVTQPATVAGSTTAQGCTQAGGGAAFTGAGSVTFCVGNPGWLTHGPIIRQKIAMHELFHVLQFEMGWLGSGATGAEWLIEGTAEMMGYRGIVSRGLVSMETALGCQAKEVSDFNAQPSTDLPNLQQLEGPQQWRNTIGPLYALAMLGVDRLSPGGVGNLRTYAEAMAVNTQYPTAFSSSFGMAPGAFYSLWPGHLASVAVPANYLCGV